VYELAGLEFPGARTAQQIRAACLAVEWDEVAPGDLLFAEHTYEPDEPPGADGRVASHVMISLGAGKGQAWSAQDPPGYVTQIDVRSDYWTERLFAAGRHPALSGEVVSPPPGHDPEQPAAARWIETIEAVNLRRGPTVVAEIVRVLPPGTRLPVTGAEAEANGYRWVQTQPWGPDPTGWVAKPYVRTVTPAK
jgi:hypothetical protein